jgi:hypothetical protein
VPGQRPSNGGRHLGGACANCHHSDKKDRCELAKKIEEDEEYEEDDGEIEANEDERKKKAEDLSRFWAIKMFRATEEDQSRKVFDHFGNVVSN